jgi:RND family efflux transporter MFP subunit
MIGRSAGIIGRAVAFVVGSALAIAAIWSVFFVDWSRERPEPEPIIRPVQTFAVGAAPERVRTFPARVRATNEVTLSFQVPGVLAKLPVIRGQRVDAGELLAQLDLRDFESRLAAARADVSRLTDELAAVTRAFEQQAANPIEVARFRTALDQAVAARDIAQKALEDATLLAPFEGVVADLFVDNFQKVAPGLQVLRLQGSDPIRVEVNVDAARVASARELRDTTRHSVRFDFLPGQEFEARLVEFTTEANRSTQTFLAILEVDPPEGVYILPGMTATLLERRAEDAPAPDELAVPITAVTHDGSGAAFVWVVGTPDGEGVAAVSRRPIEKGELHEDMVVVARGLARGERVVSAGVGKLSEGRRVRLRTASAGTAAAELPRR